MSQLTHEPRVLPVVAAASSKVVSYAPESTIADSSNSDCAGTIVAAKNEMLNRVR